MSRAEAENEDRAEDTVPSALSRERRSAPDLDFSANPCVYERLTANADIRQARKQSEDLQEPKYDYDHHNAIQNGLDGGLHRNEAVDQPKQYTHDNQCEEHMYQRCANNNLREKHSYQRHEILSYRMLLISLHLTGLSIAARSAYSASITN
jgi:hypothetical protein